MARLRKTFPGAVFAKVADFADQLWYADRVKPFWIESKQAWAVDIPSRLSHTGKRQRKFFSNRDKAREFCGDRRDEHLEHGKQAVTSDDRALVALLRKDLGGDLSIVPEVLRLWKFTGLRLNRISVADAVREFLESA